MSQPIDLSTFVQAAGDAIVAAAPDGKIVLWNPAATRIFGFTEPEALGQSLDLIIPERFRGRHWQGYAETMRSGKTKYGGQTLRVPALHKDGRTLSIAFTVTLVSAANGAITAIVAIVRDESERWQEEQALRQRLKEVESQLK